MDHRDTASGDILRTLRRQIFAIAVVAGPIFAILIGVSLGLPDVFRSTGVIRIDQDLGRDDRAVDTFAEYYVETLIDRVFGSENIRGWINEFRLFDAKKDWDDNRKVSEVRENLVTEIVTTPVIDPVSGRERDVVTGFEISYESHSPIDAQKVADAVTKEFLEENRRTRQSRGEQDIDFFREEAEKYEFQILEVEARLAEFKEKNNRQMPEMLQVNVSAMDRVERDIETTQLQIDNLKRERVILQSQLSQIPTTSDEAIEQLALLQSEYVRVSSVYEDTHPTVVSIRKQIDQLSQSVDGSEAIPILQKQLDEIALELAETRERYSDDHPDVRQLVRSENTLRERIDMLLEQTQTRSSKADAASTNDLFVQLDTQIKAIDTQIYGLNQRRNDLRVKRNEYETILLRTPQVEREYLDLMRDLENARELFEETQEKQREAAYSMALTTGSQQEQLTLVQSPQLPDAPSWPPRAAILILGTILSVGAGIAVATLREIGSSLVRDSRDVIEICGAPPITFIPTLHNRKSRAMQKVYIAGYLAGIGVIVIFAYLGAANL
jgi:uncharacterized protein involved in exopolysaccharide biosynthesis